MDEILDKLGKCQYLTTLDLAKGFHQIEKDPDSIQKLHSPLRRVTMNRLERPSALKMHPLHFSVV